MAKPDDAMLKVLVETEPESWLALAGRPPAPARVLDTDISATVSGTADKVLLVQAPTEYLVHLDFQSGHDSADLPSRLRLYNVVLEDRHELPVWSVAVVLRPEADSPRLTGILESGFPGEPPIHTFRYGVVRVSQLPVDQLLDGGLGTLPLAPVSDVSPASLSRVIRKIKARLGSIEKARDLWAATYVLLGLRYSSEIADALLQGVLSMEESTTYQAILARGRREGLQEGELEGASKEARGILLRLGQKRFAQPSELVQTAIYRIRDVQRLEELIERVSEASSWEELLAHSSRRPRNGSRGSRGKRKS
jgi:predicted transposase YdaD